MNGKTPLHITVEILCHEDIDSNKTSEYLSIMNKLLQYDVNICLCYNNILLQYDVNICICYNNMETDIHKSVMPPIIIYWLSS